MFDAKVGMIGGLKAPGPAKMASRNCKTRVFGRAKQAGRGPRHRYRGLNDAEAAVDGIASTLGEKVEQTRIRLMKFRHFKRPRSNGELLFSKR